MAQIDTSMYSAQPAPNPLSTMEGMMQMRAQANQNKLFPLLMQGQQLQNQQSQVGIDQSKLNLAHQGFQIMSQGLGALAQDPNITSPDGPNMVVRFGQQMVRSGLLTPEMFAEEMKAMPTDPKQLPQYLQTLNTRAQDAQSQFTQIYGAPGMVNNGQQQMPVATSPITGQRQIGAPIQNQQTPGELNTPTQIGTDAQGRPIMGTQKQFQERATGDDGSGGAPQNTTDLMQGAGPNGTAAPVAPQAPAGGGAQPGGGIVMGLAPGVAEAQKEDAVANTQQANNFQQYALGANDRKAQIQNMLGAARNFTSGPFANDINKFKTSLNELGLTNFDQSKIANMDEFSKLANQFATSQLQGMGGGTNEKLDVIMGGNLHGALSNEGIEKIGGMLSGIEDYGSAKNAAWQQYKTANGPQSFGQFSTQWNKNIDPRVFQASYLNPADRQKLVNSLSPAEKTKFVSTLKAIQQNGWTTGQPTQTQQAQQ